MSNARYGDNALTQLRALVAVVDQEMLEVTPALRTAWAALVRALDLGPAPQTRECPACHGIGMRAASRCGYCWAALEPLPPLEESPIPTHIA